MANLSARDAEIESLMATLPASERTVVTAHDAFGYFAQTYDMTFAAPVGTYTDMMRRNAQTLAGALGS